MRIQKLLMLLIATGAIAVAAETKAQVDFRAFGPGPDFRKPRKITDTARNPFTRSFVTEAKVEEHPAVADVPAVELAFNTRGLSGILMPTAASGGAIILGDLCFRTGDDITFFDDKGKAVPLLAGHRTSLRSLTRDRIQLEVWLAGVAAPQHLEIKLGKFLSP